MNITVNGEITVCNEGATLLDLILRLGLSPEKIVVERNRDIVPAGITLSTRERPFLRDRLIGLGITKISAGVSTAVGGHAHAAQDVAEEHDTAQFEIADDRDVDQMIAAIEAQGYQPVCKSREPLDEAYACGKSA